MRRLPRPVVGAGFPLMVVQFVGVVLNLAISFGLYVLFPSAGAMDWFAIFLSVIAFVGMWRWNWNLVAVVLGSGLVGLIYRTIM